MVSRSGRIFRVRFRDDGSDVECSLVTVLPIESIQCPYCGESIDIVIDDSVDHQKYIEDCWVYCRPINIEVSVDQDSGINVNCWTESEA